MDVGVEPFQTFLDSRETYRTVPPRACGIGIFLNFGSSANNTGKSVYMVRKQKNNDFRIPHTLFCTLIKAFGFEFI